MSHNKKKDQMLVSSSSSCWPALFAIYKSGFFISFDVKVKLYLPSSFKYMCMRVVFIYFKKSDRQAMKHAHEEEEVKNTNLLVLPSPYDHYVMWLTLLICPELPREIVTHQIMPHFCEQEIILYSYYAHNDTGFFRDRPRITTCDWLNVYYTPLIELRDKGNGVSLCDDLWPTRLSILCNRPRVFVSGGEEIGKTYDITEETTYYALCRHLSILNQRD